MTDSLTGTSLVIGGRTSHAAATSATVGTMVCHSTKHHHVTSTHRQPTAAGVSGRSLAGKPAQPRSADRRRWTTAVSVTAGQPVRPAAIADHPDELVAELLSGGAVQIEVDGVVGVHEQFGNRPGEFEAWFGDGVGSCAARATDERSRYWDDSQRQSGDEKCERNGQQHQRETRAALLRRSTLSVLVRTAVQALALATRLYHLKQQLS